MSMGATRLCNDEVDTLIAHLSAEWSGESYALMHKNCCHFSDTLCESLGVGNVPGCVVNLAFAGAMLADGVEQASSTARAVADLAASIDEQCQISTSVEAVMPR